MPRPPIAVLGVGCRMPQADGPAAFWKLLCDEVDAIVRVPADRWDAAALWSEHDLPGSTHSHSGGFVDGGDCFDAGLFGIGASEAKAMDPQQGMALESAWQALEFAAIAPDSLQGSSTGVFVGIGNSDFDRTLCSDLRNLDSRAGTGTSYSAAANRVSYALGLRGPSVAVDLACSSSLAAVHLACQSLLLGECDLALAGGVHLMLGPEKTVTFSRGRSLARDCRCKSFSALADGYVRGEGCGMIVLKRLDDARRDGDPILAVIRSSAIGHNGRSNGLSAPQGAAQSRLLRQSLVAAHLSGNAIGYVEAHAAGTRLGDLIEVNALQRVLQEGRDSCDECVVGSLKPNIGHLEAAAGIASLIKAILAIGAGRIPKTLHTAPLNPDLQLPSWMSIAAEARAWPRTNTPRRALVSTQSFAGANANVVLEEAPTAAGSNDESVRCSLLVLSARSRGALALLAERCADFLLGVAGVPDCATHFMNVCYTMALGRQHFEHRLAVVAASAQEAAEALKKQELPRVAVRSGAMRAQDRLFLTSLADQYCSGGIPDWRAVFGARIKLAALPTYPFERSRFRATAR